MPVVYSIRNWERHFEVSQSKSVKGSLSWVAIPTKHDGKSFRRLMLRPDGHEIYGAWVLIVQVAAKCTPRGVLADLDGPLDASDLAVKTSGRMEVFDKALKVLSSKEIGWLIGRDAPSTLEHAPSTLERTTSTGQDKTGQDSTVQTGECAAGAAPDEAPTEPGDVSDPEGLPSLPAPPAGPNGQPPAPAEDAVLRAEEVPVPPALDSADFRAALRDWFHQRRRRRLSLRPEFVKRQYERLLPLGPANAAACLRYTVDQDYQGLCIERFADGKHRPKSKAEPGPGQRHDPAKPVGW